MANSKDERREVRKVLYEFEIDNLIGVEADEGTDPDDLIGQAQQQALEQLAISGVEVRFYQAYDPETGDYIEGA